MEYFLIAFLMIVGIFILGAVTYQKFGLFMFFYHDILFWHDGEGSFNGFDGCSMTGTCSKCGNAVLMDRQGNWF